MRVKYQFLWSVVLPLLVSTLVSLFAGEIRSGLKRAIKRSGKTLNEGVISDLSNKLAVISFVNENAYNLVLWLLLEAHYLFFSTLVLYLVYLVAEMLKERAPIVTTVVIWLIVGTWVGRTARIWELIGMLQNYERSKTRLEEKIAYFKSPTAGGN